MTRRNIPLPELGRIGEHGQRAAHNRLLAQLLGLQADLQLAHGRPRAAEQLAHGAAALREARS